jgi:hypothetical protein
MSSGPLLARCYHSVVALALLAVMLAALAVFVAPAVVGVVSLGQRPSYQSDARAIQRAVDAYRQNPTDPRRPFPTFSGSTLPEHAVPPLEPRSGPYLDFQLLVGPPPLLSEPPRSAGVLNATGVYTGSYNWYLDSRGKVASFPEEGDVYP